MTKIDILDQIALGDCLELFPRVPDNSIRTIHTSPPYNIEKDYKGYNDNLIVRDYLDFIEKVLSECMRSLVPGGSLFWQTGYTTDQEEYITPLDHLTYHLFQKLGFRLKDRIIWRYWGGMAFKAKFTNKHETILWWVKPGQSSTQSKFDVFPVREATKFYDSRNNLFGRNPGNVWEVDRVAFGSNGQTSHIAVFPEEISDRIILSTTDENDVVLDPFSGSGTVCKIAKARGRHFIGFEISPLYHKESIQRLSLQARGELLSVLSEILKEHVFGAVGTRKFSAIEDKIMNLLSPFSLEPYEDIIKKSYLDALCAGHEDVVKKSDKIKLWNALEELLPDFGSNKSSKDSVGLISLIDRAYMRAFKLHKAYSSAMRFYCAANWLAILQSNLARDRKAGWEKILTSIAESETGTYCLTEDKISIISHSKKVKIVTVDPTFSEDSQENLTTQQLFR
ncbi:MAG: site-specific DNA-methyltransferase [Sedimentisphaerales bacterium]|nr:site-specific DNA-methyltransferase [Sedimentisphaerales bacterium]